MPIYKFFRCDSGHVENNLVPESPTVTYCLHQRYAIEGAYDVKDGYYKKCLYNERDVGGRPMARVWPFNCAATARRILPLVKRSERVQAS